MNKIILLSLFSILQLNSYCQTNDQAIEAFYQGSANNCASVALIKAAMLKYGYKNIFTFSESAGNYKITLQSGDTLSVSNTELKLAEQYSNFELSGNLPAAQQKDVLSYAYLSYAAIAKYIQLYGYWSCEDKYGNSYPIAPMYDYLNALRFITMTSFCTDNCYKLLGLKIAGGKINDYTNATVLNQKGTILYSWGHAVAANHNTIDCHGSWIPASTAKTCNNRFKWYIVLE